MIDFFDWSPLDYSDLRYYVVQIESLEGHPRRVGQHALVEVGSVCVYGTRVRAVTTLIEMESDHSLSGFWACHSIKNSLGWTILVYFHTGGKCRLFPVTK